MAKKARKAARKKATKKKATMKKASKKKVAKKSTSKKSTKKKTTRKKATKKAVKKAARKKSTKKATKSKVARKAKAGRTGSGATVVKAKTKRRRRLSTRILGYSRADLASDFSDLSYHEQKIMLGMIINGHIEPTLKGISKSDSFEDYYLSEKSKLKGSDLIECRSDGEKLIESIQSNGSFDPCKLFDLCDVFKLNQHLSKVGKAREKVYTFIDSNFPSSSKIIKTLIDFKIFDVASEAVETYAVSEPNILATVIAICLISEGVRSACNC